ncbi:MAG: YceI family protein [Trueperaceae bacterium]|nr:YceI family protein [Trueperaceae bacterium]
MTTWTIDALHTQIEFSVRHMGLSTVRGRFKAFGGSVTTGDDGAPTAVAVDIETASIDTNAADRDAHLRSPDFFDAAAHPTITFRSTGVRAIGGDRFEVVGDLTMHGVTRPITLEAEIGDPIRDPWGQARRAAVVGGKLNRKDFGLAWNQILEAGALLVGEEVRLSFDVEATSSEAVAETVGA